MNVHGFVWLSLATLASACTTPTQTVMDANFDAADATAMAESGSTDRPDVPSDNVADVPAALDVPNSSADSGTCAMGTIACGSAGCVDSQTNVNHCGTCDNACAPGLVCTGGACVVFCRAPLVRCADACVDPVNNPAHCGACDRQCVAANATPVCIAGACNLICSPGFGNCDDNAANGCESNTTNSAAHCGRCGNACPSNQRCAAGVCGLDCAMPNTICGVDAMMTCSDLRTDPANCGTCGNACSLPNAVPGCVAGSCTLASCNAGFGDCDGNPMNGCETNTNSSFANCGTCGNLCPPPQFCSGGGCRI